MPAFKLLIENKLLNDFNLKMFSSRYSSSIPDEIDIDQNAGLGDNDGDGIIDAADVDETAGTDTLISGIISVDVASELGSC